MSSGGNRALSAECPIRTKGRITRDLKLLGCQKKGFSEENEVILIAGKKGDQFSMTRGEKTVGIPLQNSEVLREAWSSLRVWLQVVDWLCVCGW